MSETVEIPKALVDHIRESLWFNYYNDLEEFVLESVRRNMESWMKLACLIKEGKRK